MCMNVYLHLCMSTAWAPGAHEDQKRAEVELHMIVSSHMGNQSWVFCRSNKCSQWLSCFSSPCILTFHSIPAPLFSSCVVLSELLHLSGS